MNNKISLIAAISENHVIGRNNRLPWSIPADLENFRKITHGKPFVMGRNSYLSEDVLLSTYKTIILSHDQDLKLKLHCYITNNIDGALKFAKDEPEIFILGGERIFRQFMPLANYIYLTIIHATIDGDAFFPEINDADWREVSRIFHQKDSRNFYDYSFVEYTRKNFRIPENQ
jgi:dihydrofolate reductase